MSSVDSNPSSLLEVKDLHVYFPIRGGVMRRQLHTVKAVSGVSLNLAQGEVLGLVGESGCGKTTLGRALVGLAPMTSGRVFFNAKELHHQNGKSVPGLAPPFPFQQQVLFIFLMGISSRYLDFNCCI